MRIGRPGMMSKAALAQAIDAILCYNEQQDSQLTKEGFYD